MADGLDVLLGSQAASAPTGLDALLAAQVQQSPDAGAGRGFVNPTMSQPSPISGWERFKTGVGDIPVAINQALWHALPAGFGVGVSGVSRAAGGSPLSTATIDQYTANRENAYQDQRAASGSTGVDWMRMGGNMAGSAPLALAAPAGGGALGAAATGAALAPLTQPVTQGDFWAEKGKQAGLGAVAGGAGNLFVRGAAAVLSPRISAAVQALRNAGVDTTIGQTLGGAAQRIEDSLTSVPFLGDMIKNAQRRVLEQFNTAAVNRSLEPIGDSLPKGTVGRDAIEYASTKLGQAYDSVLNRIGAVHPDNQFIGDLANLQGLTQNLPQAQADQFSRILDNEILSRIDPHGVMTAEGVKAAESNLGNLARGYAKSADYDARQMGTAVQQAQATLREMLGRVKPQFSDELQAINQGYANLLRPQRAAGYLGAEEGVFTPSQLQGAVKALDNSRNNRAFATGNALMQDLSEAGKSVLSSKVPDSGTPLRSAVIGGGALALGHGMPFVGPAAIPLAAGAGLASLPYTATGQKLTAALLAGNRPIPAQQLGEALRQLAPYMGAAAVPAVGAQR